MNAIQHQGTVTATTGNLVKVQITSFSACHNCEARHGCGLMDCQNKIVEVTTAESSAYQLGDKVIVSMSTGSGLWAVFWGYGLPLILMLTALIVVSASGGSELWAGISAIIILIPYYFCLFLNSKRFKQRFTFTISKL